MQKLEKLLTRAEAAELLRKPISWMKYAERHKLIPSLRVGQQVRYSPSDLAQWIEQHKVPVRTGD
jgi:hypothetical protein